MGMIDTSKPVWVVYGKISDGRRATEFVNAIDASSAFVQAKLEQSDFVSFEYAVQADPNTGKGISERFEFKDQSKKDDNATI